MAGAVAESMVWMDGNGNGGRRGDEERLLIILSDTHFGSMGLSWRDVGDIFRSFCFLTFYFIFLILLVISFLSMNMEDLNLDFF